MALRFVPNPVKIVRGLRFRLALSYVLFFAALLAILGFIFKQQLSSIQERQVEAVRTQWVRAVSEALSPTNWSLIICRTQSKNGYGGL